jgi:hypothetical protein
VPGPASASVARTNTFASPTSFRRLGFHWSEKMPPKNELTLLPKLPLLITESADEFDVLRGAFEREIKPRGIVEHMYLHDICAIV